MIVTIEGVEITLTSEQVKKIEDGKKPSPEKRFWQLCEGLELKTDWEKYPNSVFFFKGDDYWLEYQTNNSVLWCDYNRLWSVFEKEYGMNYNEIQALIKNVVEEHFKMKGVTPMVCFFRGLWYVEDHFNKNLFVA